jgi:hypothetical protein
MPVVRIVLLAAAGWSMVGAQAAAVEAILAAPSPDGTIRFLRAHCRDCHAGKGAEAGFDVDELITTGRALDPHATDRDARWALVIDRVAAGEMPPPEAAALPDAKREKFVTTASAWLRDTVRARDAAQGRVRGRRLTRHQLERSLHMLLGVDIRLADMLPEEIRPGDYTTIADRQTTSHHQLERHLAVVDAALDEAFGRALTPPFSLRRDLDAKAIARQNPQSRCREPEIREDRAVVWTGNVTYYGRLPAVTSPRDGWYRFRVTVSGIKPPATGGVWTTVNTGLCVSSAPLLEFVTAFEAVPEPRSIEFTAWLPKGHMLEIRPGDAALPRGKFAGGQIGTGEGEPQNVPGIAIDRVEMERVFLGPDDDGVRSLLFGDVPVVADGKNGGRRPAASAAEADLTRLLADFARRAFRRPLAAGDLDGILALARQTLTADGDFAAAVRAGYRAILCSPRFLYFTETPGPLDDHAIAARLSYFLTGGPPDAELTAAADAGSLQEPAERRCQADRLLTGPGGRRFIEDFAAEWLDLDQIDFTEPDRKLFPEYDAIVQRALVAETHALLEECLQDDLPVTRLVTADHAHLDSRLARFYRIPNVAGDELQRVLLPPESHRGGLLTQGAVLKVTANGNDTSPVVRGVWVLERLLGQRLHPPAAGVPAIEPDIRGSTTIREQLAKHRADAACASCHRQFDPLGFALEHFDPAGQWRDSYVRIGKKGRERGRPVDAADVLPDGRRFSGIDEFKTLLAADPVPLAHGLAGHLLVYGTGGRLSFADRAAVAEIVATAAHPGGEPSASARQHAGGGLARHAHYGVRSIVLAVVAHPIFASK